MTQLALSGPRVVRHLEDSLTLHETSGGEVSDS